MIIITGQTTTGKTKLALKYAHKHNSGLINFDSRQIYKYLDIITGKDLPKNSKFISQNSKLKITNYSAGYYKIPFNKNNSKNLIKLWLYDIVFPDQYFSSFEYVKIAYKLIKYFVNQKKTPIFVGGTYFYLKHLLYGVDYSVPPDFNLRKILDKKSIYQLRKILLSLVLSSYDLKQKNLKNKKIYEINKAITFKKPPDFININESDWGNPRRLIRRIEIEKYKKSKNHKTGQEEKATTFFFDQNKSLFYLNNNNKQSLPVKIIGLKYKNKEDLIRAVKNRVEERLQKGAINETERIIKMGYKKTHPGLNTIGYKQIIDYLEGKTDLKTAINNWITAEVQYAKRQMTFMKKDKNISWIEI